MRRAHLAALLLAATACSSHSSARSCGYQDASAITGPGAAYASPPRFHGSTTTRNADWASELTLAMSEMPSDSVVRALIVHASAVTDADRALVADGGGTIVDEPDAWNGIVATFAVTALREFATEHAEAMRIYDVHLVTEVVLPPCD